MKTKEFIKKVEELGLRVKNCYKAFEISNATNQIAFVEEEKTLAFSTTFYKYYDLDEEIKEKLFDLLVEYARTPIEEREEEKKYYLRHRWLCDYTKHSFKFLNKVNDAYSINDDFETAQVKTEFTQKEIDNIKKTFNTDLSDFEMIEVKEE